MRGDKPVLLSFPMISPELLHSMGAALTAENIDFLLSLGVIRQYPKDAVLVHQGERIGNLMFMVKGLTRSIGTGISGIEKTFTYTTAGCFLGLEASLHGQPVIFEMRTLELSDILLIDGAHICKIASIPNIALFLLKSTALTSRILAMQIEDASLRTTQQTICRILFYMSDEACAKYKPHFTHQEIADLAGVHRVTVTNTLTALKKEGIVSFQHKGHIEVLCREELRRKSCE